MSQQSEPTVIARCVGCKKTREIGPGEVGPDDVPMCDSCFMPMFAVSASLRVSPDRSADA